MAKKIVAVTNIKHGGKFFENGTELNASEFPRDVLKSLHDSGAIRVDEVADEALAVTTTKAAEKNGNEDSGK